MKRMIIWLIVAMLLCSQAALADAIITEPGAEHLSKDEALAIAQEAASTLEGIFADEIAVAPHRTNFVAFDSSETPYDAWVVTFFPAESEEGMGAPLAAIIVSSPDGEVRASSDATVWEMPTILHPEKGPYTFWSLEDKVLFDALYVPTQEMAYILPDETAIPAEEALQIARETILYNYETTEADLDGLRTVCDLMRAENFDPAGVWFVTYCESEPDVDGNHPMVYQVDIAATTGEVLDIFSDEESNG